MICLACYGVEAATACLCMHCLAETCLRAMSVLRSFDNVHGSDPYGNPVDEFPDEVLDSIKRNGVCFSPTL